MSDRIYLVDRQPIVREGVSSLVAGEPDLSVCGATGSVADARRHIPELDPDLVITGLLGLRPRADDIVEVNPLLPGKWWQHFCLDNIPYHGHTLTILWDRDGTEYGRGRGLRVYADGSEIAASSDLSRVTGKLPEMS